jgi:hypothetical protein
MGFEPAYGAPPPAGGFMWAPVMSIDPGITRPVETMDVVGGGREGGYIADGLLTVAPTVVTPIDDTFIGLWLQLTFGAPVTTPTDGGLFDHVFTSGAPVLPSGTVEKGSANLADFRRMHGLRVNTLTLPFNFSAAAQTATLAMVGLSHDRADTSVDAGLVAPPDLVPLLGSNGVATRNGAPLANITSGSLTISNGLETIRAANNPGGGIAQAAPGLLDVTGSLSTRLADKVLPNDAGSGTPIDLALGYIGPGGVSLMVRVAHARLELADYPISGRAGIQASYNLMGRKAAATNSKVQVTLRNAKGSYA